MKPKIYRIILIFISLTILATIGLQIRWNVSNYNENERRVLNDIQIAMDNTVENYYAEAAKKDVMLFIGDRKLSADSVIAKKLKTTDSVFTQTFRYKKRNDKKREEETTVELTANATALDSFHDKLPKPNEIKTVRIRKSPEMSEFANRIYVSLFHDSLNFQKLDSIFGEELKRKNIELDYGFAYSGTKAKTDVPMRTPKASQTLSIASKSTYLPPGESLKLKFGNPFFAILSRGYVEIILSLLFSLAIIGCLLYLLHIINRQKKIDEIRNDLISNITHEFKTPITTIGSAIEGIRNFNATNDTEKTNRYLDISERQLAKLQIMVEKLLDTATLDTDALVLNKEPIDLKDLLHSVSEKFLIEDSRISISAENIHFIVNGDLFHLENALSNLLDNAVKYGGKEINLRLEKSATDIFLFIEDNGNGIDKSQRERIFEKFYRIPTGNVHDVKGFGIGLFYSRKIIEKHGGNLDFIPDNNWTIFKIRLPHA